MSGSNPRPTKILPLIVLNVGSPASDWVDGVQSVWVFGYWFGYLEVGTQRSRVHHETDFLLSSLHTVCTENPPTSCEVSTCLIFAIFFPPNYSLTSSRHLHLPRKCSLHVSLQSGGWNTPCSKEDKHPQGAKCYYYNYWIGKMCKITTIVMMSMSHHLIHTTSWFYIFTLHWARKV